MKAQKLPKLERPKIRALREIYKGLLSLSIQSRLNTLREALTWYDHAMEYLGQKKGDVLISSAKILNIAIKTRRLGLDNNQENEQERALHKSIQLYEKVCVLLKPSPIDESYKRFEELRGKMEKKQESLTDRFSSLVELLTAALAPKNSYGQPIQIAVIDRGDPRKFDPTRNHMDYSRVQAKVCMQLFRRQGLLPLVAQEIKWLSRGAGLENDGQGGFVLNLKKQSQAMFEMLDNFAGFCATDEAPRRLAKSAVPIVASQGVEPESTGPENKPLRNTPRGPRGGVKVGGRFVPGSAMAILYELLSDQEWHEKSELKPKVPADLIGRLRAMMQIGKQDGTWLVEENGSQCKMIVTSKAQ